MRNLGIILIALGVVLMLITGFNYVTSEKVVDVGKLEINKEKSHPVRWSPIIGAVLLVAGVVVLLGDRRKVI